MKKLLVAIGLILTGAPAFAAGYPPVPYITAPIEPGTAPFNSIVSSVNLYSEGLLHALPAATSTVITAGEQVLDSYTLPANYLTTIGQSVRLNAWFTAVNNANTKTPKLYFGSTAITGTAVTTAGVPMRLSCTATKTGASTQSVICDGVTLITPITPVYTAATEADTAAILLKAVCTAPTGAADCSLVNFTIEAVR